MNTRESLETIRQNMRTLETLFSNRTSLPYSAVLHSAEEEIEEGEGAQLEEVQPFNFEGRKLQVGQWVDVKDTIDQWLEAQVVDLRES